ncbi:gamma-glutamyl peptidase 5 [Aegilops tauschii subsp. strangulata]|uniref:Glutamine amidotransferase domain-containing protein n=1 Tax=Aegilops tauschii subsp. strangulata TaxID=200361 RepID=A0A453NI14_AEGTS|nr:gamma-glutamyl peptidase 5 [Aegilops tauschii subsp. strangulata]
MTVAAAGAGRRYALLLAVNDSDYARKAHGGYRNVFFRALRSGEPDEAWDCYRVIDGEFPAAEDLGLYDGFVVSGSPHDAHGDGAPCWVRRLCLLLRTVHAMGKRVLGVCFGHQALCRALGGRIGRSPSGWDVGVKEVTFVDDLEWPFEFLPVEPPRSASIIEVHQDEVWEVPPGGKVLAYSNKTRVEMFAVGDNALGIQGHPEYTNDILLNLTNRLVNNSTIDGCVGEDARRTAESGEPDREFWTGLCKAFLRGSGCTGGGGAPRPPPQGPAPELSCSHQVAHFPATASPIGL